MSVDQLRLPKTTCPLPFAEGAATCTTWISRAMATASSSVSVYWVPWPRRAPLEVTLPDVAMRSEEHTSELQSRFELVCRLLLEKKNSRADDVHEQTVARIFTRSLRLLP